MARVEEVRWAVEVQDCAGKDGVAWGAVFIISDSDVFTVGEITMRLLGSLPGVDLVSGVGHATYFGCL